MDTRTTFMKAFDDGIFAASCDGVCERILQAKVPMKPVPDTSAQYLWTSGFPETGRLIWLMPTRDYSIAVIEAPIDDPGPFTIWHALASSELWRWKRADSPKYVNKLGNVCQDYAISMPQDRTVMKPVWFDFPPDWTNMDGKRRKNMQIHCILSPAACARTKRLTGAYNMGAYCSMTHLGNNHTPASQGCGFIARASYYGGALFSDGLANAAFNDDAHPGRGEEYFGFRDRQWNDEVWTFLKPKGLNGSILGLLYGFTICMRQQLHV